MPPADHNHNIIHSGEFPSLLLTHKGSITYCIKNFRICTYFFENIFAFFRNFFIKSRLTHKNYIFICKIFLFLKQVGQFCGIGKNVVLTEAMPDNADHFLMMAVARDQNYISFSAFLFHDRMDLGNKRTGGVYGFDSARAGVFQHIGGDAVRADHQNLIFLHFLRGMDDARAAPG